MSPEQLLALDRVDHLGDIYALGVIMFECLTGRLPCDGVYQSVLRYASSTDAPPRADAHVPEVGEKLGSIVQRAMAKRREDRFPSALELARAIHEAFPAASGRTFFLGPAPVPRYAVAMPVDATQRRRTPRVPYVTPVRVTLPGGAGLDGRSEDISEGGLLVITRQPCEPTPRASLQFALPLEGTTQTCDAVVRWVRAARQDLVDGPRALGLEFIDPPAGLLAAIKRYVEIMGGTPAS
jgi:hypothetical protein